MKALSQVDELSVSSHHMKHFFRGRGRTEYPENHRSLILPPKPFYISKTLFHLNFCTFSVSSCTRHLRTHCSSAFLLDFHSSSNFLLLWLNVSKVLSILKQAAFVACLLLMSAWELASLRRSSSNCPLESVCMDSSSKLRRSSWCSCMRDFDMVTSPASKVCPSCSSTWLILWENYENDTFWYSLVQHFENILKIIKLTSIRMYRGNDNQRNRLGTQAKALTITVIRPDTLYFRTH